MNKPVSSKHLEAVSDLTLLAPIRQGFVPAFESVTYETRLQLLLKALFKIRSTAREHSIIKPFVDTAERIQSLLDFRLAVLPGEPRQLMLSATFDRPFEPYMRLIWDPLGPLLDVIFCNCEGYVTATGHGFEDYLTWVRRSQVDSDFFYSMSGHSVSDVQYLLRIERLQREKLRQSGATIYVPNPEEEAERIRTAAATRDESRFLGMEALVALYRLTDFYPPDDPEGDGELLRTAAQQLLSGWGWDLPLHWQALIPDQLAWFKHGLAKPESDKEKRQKEEEERESEKRSKAARLKFDTSQIQGGIVDAYDKAGPPIRHGALMLMRVVDPVKARAFIGSLDIQDGTHGPAAAHDEIYRNLALTWHGLNRLGLPDAELARFPQEFREGMEERAGLLGDLRASHPRRWLPPLRNWPSAAAEAGGRISLSEVDLVVQLRTTRTSEKPDLAEIHDPAHPLLEEVKRLADQVAVSGVELIAVEPMRRASPDTEEKIGRDHFGFIDGISQPEPVDGNPSRKDDQVARGEILWGYPNGRADAPPPPSVFLDNGTYLVVRKLRQNAGRLNDFVKRAAAEEDMDPEILYGKMVGRMRSGKAMVPGAPDSDTFNKFNYERDEAGEYCPFQSHVRRSNPRAKREGFTRRPTPRILRRGLSYGPPFPDGGKEEDDDKDRGVMFMAYGASIAEQYEVIQRWVNSGNSSGVGSWLSDPLMGVSDRERDLPRVFRVRYFEARPGHGKAGDGSEEAAALETADPERPGTAHRFKTRYIAMSKPFVELQWGLYLFVPSIAAIRAIVAHSPVEAQEDQTAREREEIGRGARIIAQLQALAQSGSEGRGDAAARWKACLEDFRAKDPAERGDGPAVWAAIRTCHRGVLRVPYGESAEGARPPDVVLVASKDLVMRVFEDRDGAYSMSGQMARMRQSFGEIFLGLDRGDEYDRKAIINGPVYAIGAPAAFTVAYLAAAGLLKHAFDLFAGMKFPDDPPNAKGVWGELDLRRDFVTPVLGAVCNQWFGIPDTLTPAGRTRDAATEDEAKDGCDPNHVDLGGWSFAGVRKPRCPGDFLATSRYCFYPDPVPRVQAYGKAQGRALREAVRAHFTEQMEPQAPVAKAMNGIPVYRDDRDEFARTLIGIMTGFLPPTDASLRWTLYDWLEEKEFWRLQQDLLGAKVDPATLPGDDEFGDDLAPARLAMVKSAYGRARAALLDPLKRAMQKRPSPDMLWRTATRRHKLGGVDIEDGDRVFIGIVSAVAEDANAGVADVFPIFGGNRSADKAPLHACPAYKFAIGTMLGILAALMDAVTVEALPAPLLVRIRGRGQAPGNPPAPAPSGS